jgi:hypothetical protein
LGGDETLLNGTLASAPAQRCRMAQAKCFDSKIMTQPSVFPEKGVKFSDQNNLRAISVSIKRFFRSIFGRRAAGRSRGRAALSRLLRQSTPTLAGLDKLKCVGLILNAL